MKIEVGDKITLKDFNDLPEKTKKIIKINGEEYSEKFGGKTLTVSNVLKKNPYIVEFEEDENEELNFSSLLMGYFGDFESPIIKKHHFSENYFAKIDEKVGKINSNEEFIKKSKQLVLEHINKNLPKGFQPRTIEDVFVVWSCKTLQNYKALLSAKGKGVMYYELTYNGDAKELYLDAYKKFEHKTIEVK